LKTPTKTRKLAQDSITCEISGNTVGEKWTYSLEGKSRSENPLDMWQKISENPEKL
jgi:hypothetical protein